MAALARLTAHSTIGLSGEKVWIYITFFLLSRDTSTGLTWQTALTLHFPGEFTGEEDVGHLALCVGSCSVVDLLTVNVLEVDLANEVGDGGQVDNAGGCRVLQEVQQKKGEKEVT